MQQSIRAAVNKCETKCLETDTVQDDRRHRSMCQIAKPQAEAIFGCWNCRWRDSFACHPKKATAANSNTAFACRAVCTLVMSATQPSSAGPSISPAHASSSSASATWCSVHRRCSRQIEPPDPGNAFCMPGLGMPILCHAASSGGGYMFPPKYSDWNARTNNSSIDRSKGS